MTEVTFTEYYGKTEITVDGHCEYAQKGTDIVCAAVSTLVCTLVNCIRDEEASDRLNIINETVRDGYVNLEFEIFSFAQERVNGILDTIMTGLYMISEEFPGYIKIN